MGADYYYFAPTYHQLLRIHFSAFSARRSFSRFLRNTIIVSNHAIPDINQLSFVSNGIMVLICLYLMTKDQGSFCCTEAKLDQLAVVCNTESVVIRS